MEDNVAKPVEQQDSPPPPQQGSGVTRFLNQHVKPFAFMVLILFAVRSSIADWNDVPTGSMNPSIIEGDRIFVNKLAYDLKVPFTTWHLAQWGEPKTGEVVVFYAPKDGTRMVKRVVGMPGDKVELRNNKLFVNDVASAYGPADPSFVAAVRGRPLAGPVISESLGGNWHPVMQLPQRPQPHSNYGPAVVPAGKYFVMGDNRDNSADSREWGFVPRDQIVGRAVGVAISLDPDSSYVPRWSRFFTPLP